jgi:hypothetical protein
MASRFAGPRTLTLRHLKALFYRDGCDPADGGTFGTSEASIGSMSWAPANVFSPECRAGRNTAVGAGVVWGWRGAPVCHLMTTAEVAAYFRVDASTVRRCGSTAWDPGLSRSEASTGTLGPRSMSGLLSASLRGWPHDAKGAASWGCRPYGRTSARHETPGPGTVDGPGDEQARGRERELRLSGGGASVVRREGACGQDRG